MEFIETVRSSARIPTPRLIDIQFFALGKKVPEKLPAALTITINNFKTVHSIHGGIDLIQSEIK